jgi:predicted enzyme related to lactoylglutathione lyase
MNRVVHFEIHAADPQRAIDFYKKIFGWEFTNWGSNEYWLVKTGPDDTPGINGGLIKRRGEIDGQAVIAYVCTIGVDSVDKTSKAVTENKGEIVVPKMPIPGVGWLIYCKDTEGNIFGIHQEDPSAK